MDMDTIYLVVIIGIGFMMALLSGIISSIVTVVKVRKVQTQIFDLQDQLGVEIVESAEKAEKAADDAEDSAEADVGDKEKILRLELQLEEVKKQLENTKKQRESDFTKLFELVEARFAAEHGDSQEENDDVDVAKDEPQHDEEEIENNENSEETEDYMSMEDILAKIIEDTQKVPDAPSMDEDEPLKAVNEKETAQAEEVETAEEAEMAEMAETAETEGEKTEEAQPEADKSA